MKFRLQFNAGHSRHMNVGNEASRLLSGFRLQEWFGGTETNRRQTLRFD
jgi:hypothetical protein